MTESGQARVAVFVSGGGSNLQSLIDAATAGRLSAQIVLVVSNTSKAFGLERAKGAGIDTFVFRVKKYETPEAAGDALMEALQSHQVGYIVLAGFLKLLPDEVVKAFPKRIINIHPALLPKFGGKGMYGHFVHEAVLEAGETESGPTVHLVDETYDTGRILEQVKVPVLADDTPDRLAARVLEQEHQLLPRVLEKLIRGEYE